VHARVTSTHRYALASGLRQRSDTHWINLLLTGRPDRPVATAQDGIKVPHRGPRAHAALHSRSATSPCSVLRPRPVVMIVYLHAALDERLSSGRVVTNEDVERSVIDGAVLRLRPKLMTVLAVIGSLGPILWESGISSDVMKPIAAPIVGGMVTSTLAVMILVALLFMALKERQLARGTLRTSCSPPA
jgi:hypothetical protein